MASGRDAATLEGENDLLQFLKVVQPDWSMPRRHQSSDINRIVKKLKGIGVKDSWDLTGRVTTNKINEDLAAAGHPRFSRETLDRIRKHAAFFRALENLTEAHYRQVGVFAPVAQMLSKTNLKKQADKRKSEQRTLDETCAGMPLRWAGDDGDHTSTAGMATWPRSRRVGSLSLDRTGTHFEVTSTPSVLRAVLSCGDDGYEERPRLRGYRGDVRGTAVSRSPGTPKPMSASAVIQPLPSLHSGTGLFSAARPARTLLGTPSTDFGGLPVSRATSLSKSPFFGGTLAVEGSTMASHPVLGGVLLERARGRSTLYSGDAFDRPGSPASRSAPRSAWPVCLEVELRELGFVAAASTKTGGPGGLAIGVEDAFERLARWGEEELSFLDVCKSFHAQGGNDAQALRIAAHYCKFGLDPIRVCRTLMNSALTMSQVRQQLDVAVVRRMRKAGEDMTNVNRPSCWAGFARSSSAPSFVSGGGGPCVSSTPGSPTSTGSVSPVPVPVAAPTWKEKGRRSVDRYANQMLQEQEELQAKRRLFRVMEAEGSSSPTRKFVVENIRSRLAEDKDYEAEKMEVQQTCNNIRRQIVATSNAKKELNTLRRSIEAEEGASRVQYLKEAADLAVAFGMLRS